MGMYLDTMFCSNYYAIGFAFKQGGFQALNVDTKKLEKFYITDCKKNTLTKALSLSDTDAFFIDLTVSNNKSLRTLQGAYFIGSTFKPEYWGRYSKKLNVKEQFDGLIFINTTSCVTPIIRQKIN